MKKLTAIFLLLLMAMVSPAFAKAKKKEAKAPGMEGRIVEITALSITISVGKTGEDHVTYNISKDTVVKFDGATASADNLRAGMTARVEATPNDKGTAKEIEAKDPPKH